MKYFAVMGYPIAHSLSPRIHQLFAEQTGISLRYEKIEIDLERFEQQVDEFFKQGGFGLNITLPCKERAFAMADEVSPRCLKAKAANTLWKKNGALWADNTDGVGLVRDLSRFMTLKDKRILLIGAGGAARGVLGPLLETQPMKLTLTNRTLARAIALQQEFMASGSDIAQQTLAVCGLEALRGPYELIIHATSAQFSASGLQLSPDIIKNAELCYDLSYQKDGLTPFVTYAQSLQCNAVDGIGMLVEQAAEAFYIWHGVRPVVDEALFKKINDNIR